MTPSECYFTQISTIRNWQWSTTS